MMLPLTKLQRDTLVFITEHVGAEGRGPTYEELRQGLEMRSVSSVRRHVKILTEARLLQSSRTERPRRFVPGDPHPVSEALALLPSTATTFSVRLSGPLRDTLAEICDKTRLPAEQIIVQALRDFTSRHEASGPAPAGRATPARPLNHEDNGDLPPGKL
ncbi:hypothetical protein [Salinarimonas soli]|uniref:LexA repressor DNA-binding domain-containing protein n=1 Tax=Salinarimonas soli TaxID=1638099 RepID=A0A5B2V8F1_9HYPH|nr:hypothetical protein [Salinarimonas soli]KAA2235251.1 hypothetical protein F0L46_21145 [Salinarimonas soli]